MPKTEKRSRQAVDAPKTNIFKMDPDDLFIITDKTNPRYDVRADMPLNDGLLNSVESEGVIEPVIACKNGAVIEVLDGRQRVRCARRLNEHRRGADKILVPVLFKRAADDSRATFVQDSANIHVPDSILTRARKMHHRLETLSRSEDEVARRFGVSIATVRLYQRLLDLIPEAQRAVDESRLSVKDGAALAKMTRDEQATELPKLAARREPQANGSNGTNGHAKRRPDKLQSGRPSIGTLKRLAAFEFKGDDPWERVSARQLMDCVVGKTLLVDFLASYPRLALALEKKRAAKAA